MQAELAPNLTETRDCYQAGVAAAFRNYDDGADDWLYIKALWLFRTNARAKATRALNAAIFSNAWVPFSLFGAKAMPRTLPDYGGMGDANEAIAYVAAAMEDWNTTPEPSNGDAVPIWWRYTVRCALLTSGSGFFVLHRRAPSFSRADG